MPIQLNEYRLTPQDTIEELRERTALAKGRKSLFRILFGWILFVVLLLCVLVLTTIQRPIPRASAIQPPSPPEFTISANPWGMLVLILQFPLMVFTLAIGGFRRTSPSPFRADGKAKSLFSWIAIVVLAMVALPIAFGPGLLERKPHVEFSPWSLFYLQAGIWFALCFILIAITKLRARKGSALGEQDSSARLPYHATISEDGIYTQSEQTRTHMNWSHYRAFLETTNLIVLYPKTVAATVQFLPKRAFASDADLFAAKELIGRHIPVGRFLGPAGAAFPVLAVPVKPPPLPPTEIIQPRGPGNRN